MKYIFKPIIYYIACFFITLGWLFVLIPMMLIPKAACLVWHFKDTYEYEWEFKYFNNNWTDTANGCCTPLGSEVLYNYKTYFHYIWNIKKGGRNAET